MAKPKAKTEKPGVDGKLVKILTSLARDYSAGHVDKKLLHFCLKTIVKGLELELLPKGADRDKVYQELVVVHHALAAHLAGK